MIDMQNQTTAATPELNEPDYSAVDKKKRNDEFRSRIDICKAYRKKLITNWALNIDMRRGKPFASQTDEDRIAVNLDWSLTKAKQASLFSQVPQVRISHPPQTTNSPWLHVFEQRINDILPIAGIEAAMDEELPDVINAAGIGGILVSYDAITVDKEVPVTDLSMFPPEIREQILQTKLLPDGTPLEMTVVPQILDKRYLIERVSPADLLWPINFTGSDFDKAPWIGRSGRITWANAVKRFKLKESDKSSVLGDSSNITDQLVKDLDKDKIAATEMVGFDELWYKDFQYDTNATSFSSIHHLVFIQSKDTPVIDEPWKGQRFDEDSKQLIGARKVPMRIITLNYITDEAIPPSDSAVGRPQINELNKMRTQNIQQRERSLPIRWMDINRIDPTIQYSLMKGTWQTIIPVQGAGDKILGEVARANYPQENFIFDRITKGDLSELWSVGPNQTGTGQDTETSGEANIIESNFQTRIGRERARVGSHFCSIAEVLGGLMCLYEDPTSFGEGFNPNVSTALSYSILADSTVLLDSNQKLKRLVDFVNFAAKSGWVNIEPVLKEIAELSGLDPAQVITPPKPRDPKEPTISLRLTGIEDLLNPLTLAFLMKTGQAPSPALIEQAKQLIGMSVIPPQPIPQPQPVIGPDGTPQTQPIVEQPMTPAMPILTPHPGPLPQVQPPGMPPPQIGEANPKWSSMPRVNRRAVGTGESEDQ